jgi:hypothetical protein
MGVCIRRNSFAKLLERTRAEVPQFSPGSSGIFWCQFGVKTHRLCWFCSLPLRTVVCVNLHPRFGACAAFTSS